MGLKSLRTNYTKLLKAFNEAGVQLNESQKESLDTFMLDLEGKINETRDNAIRATKKVLESKLEKEYKAVVESIISNQAKVYELAGKIQNKVSSINESKEMANILDNFLDTYVEEVLPKKTIVDYDKMKKLESIHESLKGMLLVNDDAVTSKVEELKGEMVKESSELKEKVTELEKKLNESMKKELSLNKRLDESNAREFVSEKIKDLPVLEAKEMKRRLSGMGMAEVKKNFKSILESVQEKIQDEQTQSQEEKNLEEAISDILNEKEKTSEKNGEKQNTKETETIQQMDDGNLDMEEESTEEIQNDNSVQITESMMTNWIAGIQRFTPTYKK